MEAKMIQTWRQDSLDTRDREEGQGAKPTSISPPTALVERLEKDARRDTLKALFSLIGQNGIVQQFEMTVAEFVARKFVPGHVALKETSGRIHYQAILRHVLTPEEVDGAFGVVAKGSRRLLRPVPGWPYLSNVRLCDVQPDHVQRLVSVAMAHGYSFQTVRHIRNVVRTIFSHARRELCFMGENPASLARLPETGHMQAQSLTLEQVKEAVGAMHYPEKEMVLLSTFTGMSPAEISGFQWKQVNLTSVEVNTDGTRIPPRTIAVRKQWCNGALESLKDCSIRNLPIPHPLFQILLDLKRRDRFTSPDDFVLVTEVGKPINQKDIVARKLRPIAKQLGLPSLSVQTFRRTRKILASELGKQFQEFSAIVVCPVPPQDYVRQKWRCRAPRHRFQLETNRDPT
jgi:integrase